MRPSGNNLVVMEFRGRERGELSIDINRLADIAKAFCDLAELGALPRPLPRSERTTLLYLRLVAAEQGSLIVYFEPVIRWLQQNREAVSHYASIISVPIALLALCGVGHSDTPEKPEPEYEEALKQAKLRQKDRDVDDAVDHLMRQLENSGSRTVRITVPGAPPIEITISNDRPEEGEHYQAFWTVESHLAKPIANKIRTLQAVDHVRVVWTEEGDGKTLTRLEVRFNPQTAVRDLHNCRAEIVEIIKHTRAEYYA